MEYVILFPDIGVLDLMAEGDPCLPVQNGWRFRLEDLLLGTMNCDPMRRSVALAF